MQADSKNLGPSSKPPRPYRRTQRRARGGLPREKETAQRAGDRRETEKQVLLRSVRSRMNGMVWRGMGRNKKTHETEIMRNAESPNYYFLAEKTETNIAN
jgi:hypothetical protein